MKSQIISFGTADCLGEAKLEEVEFTDDGQKGPWIRTTCNSCSLHWYAVKR